MSMLSLSITARHQRQQREAYAVLIVAFVLLWVADAFTTLAALTIGWHEGNHGFLILAALIGPVGAFVVKFCWGFVLIGFSLIAYRVLPRATCWALAVASGTLLAVVLSNTAHLIASFLLTR